MVLPLSLPDAAMLAKLDKGTNVGRIVVGVSKPDGGVVLTTDVKERYGAAINSITNLAVDVDRSIVRSG